MYFWLCSSQLLRVSCEQICIVALCNIFCRKWTWCHFLSCTQARKHVHTHTHKITILGYCLFSLKLFLVAMESLLSLLYIFPLLLLRCQTLVFLSRKIKTLTASLSSKPPSVARHSFPVSLLVAVNIFVLPRLLRESHGHADTGSLWFMSRLFFPPQSY